MDYKALNEESWNEVRDLDPYTRDYFHFLLWGPKTEFGGIFADALPGRLRKTYFAAWTDDDEKDIPANLAKLGLVEYADDIHDRGIVLCSRRFVREGTAGGNGQRRLSVATLAGLLKKRERADADMVKLIDRALEVWEVSDGDRTDAEAWRQDRQNAKNGGRKTEDKGDVDRVSTSPMSSPYNSNNSSNPPINNKEGRRKKGMYIPDVHTLSPTTDSLDELGKALCKEFGERKPSPDRIGALQGFSKAFCKAMRCKPDRVAADNASNVAKRLHDDLTKFCVDTNKKPPYVLGNLLHPSFTTFLYDTYADSTDRSLFWGSVKSASPIQPKPTYEPDGPATEDELRQYVESKKAPAEEVEEDRGEEEEVSAQERRENRAKARAERVNDNE